MALQENTLQAFLFSIKVYNQSLGKVFTELDNHHLLIGMSRNRTPYNEETKKS